MDLYTDHYNALAALAAANPTGPLLDYQADVADADVAWATSVRRARKGYHGDLTSALSNYTPDLNAADVGYAQAMASADAALSVATSTAESARSYSEVDAWATWDLGVTTAEKTRSADNIAADGQYRVDMTDARRVYDDAYSASYVTYIAAIAPAQADFYLGNITVAQYEAALAAAAQAVSNQTALVAKVASDGNADIARATIGGTAVPTCAGSTAAGTAGAPTSTRPNQTCASDVASASADQGFIADAGSAVVTYVSAVGTADVTNATDRARRGRLQRGRRRPEGVRHGHLGRDRGHSLRRLRGRRRGSPQ